EAPEIRHDFAPAVSVFLRKPTTADVTEPEKRNIIKNLFCTYYKIIERKRQKINKRIKSPKK
ncbi:hypothetical protein SeLEV6574_g08037, partial [Synchytrium endobioticum]